MTNFTLHTVTSAPESAQAQLREIEKNWKMIPNLHRILAESPETLAAYDTLFGLFAKSSLTTVEQHVAYLAVIYANECEYCMAGHSMLAAMSGVAKADIAALREGLPLQQPKLAALQQFATAVTQQRGFVGDAAVEAFIGAGFTRQNVLEVVLAVATKTISNYTNHLTHTPNDAFMAGTSWTAPRNR
jgi:uncharacterized peroxidase-related enzyme